MDYQEFVTTQFIPRVLAALNAMRDTLIAAGVSANRITVGEVDATNLRYRITTVRGSRTLVAYFELTPVGIIDGEMSLVITLYVEGNGSEITHSYTVGLPQRYITDLDTLLAKLTSAELTMGEVTV